MDELKQFFCNCEVIPIKNEDHWHELRSDGIGGSDVSIMLNINRYKTPYQLYLEKTKQKVPEKISNVAIEKGNRLEQPLIDVFFALHPEYTSVNTKNISLKSREFEYMHANLDGAFLDEEGTKCILEIKTTTIQNKDMLHDWGYYDQESREWIERVPDNYYAQVLHYMIVTGFRKVIIYALLDFSYKKGQEIRETIITYDEAIEDINLIIKEEKRFWRRIVEKDPPPFLERKINI